MKITCHQNESRPYDGTDIPWEWVETILFEDDMESGPDKWVHMIQPTGSMWHLSDTCSYPDDDGGQSAANFDPSPWSSYNEYMEGTYVNLVWLGPDYAHYGTFSNYFTYENSYLNYRNNADDKLILTVDLSGVYQAWLRYEVNYSVEAGFDYLVLEASGDDGSTWQELRRYTGDSGGWIDQTLGASVGFEPYNYGISLNNYVGDELMLRWRLLSDGSVNDRGIQLDDVRILGKVDDAAPVTVASLNPATPNGCNGWYTSAVTITLTAQDDIGMGTTFYRINGGSWLTYTAPIAINTEGEFDIDYYSVDAVGNEETAKTVSFAIDRTAPTGSIGIPQTGYIYFFGRELMPRILVKDKALIFGGLIATASASDGGSGVHYVTFTTSAGSVEDAVAPYQYPLPFYLFGSDTLTVSVTDMACNSASIGSVDFFKIF